MRKVIRIGTKRKSKSKKQEKAVIGDINARIELIQALIPIGLMAVSEQLEEEVVSLAGEKYSREGACWASPMGESTEIDLFIRPEDKSRCTSGPQQPGEGGGPSSKLSDVTESSASG